MEILSSKRLVPKPIKLLEGTGNCINMEHNVIVNKWSNISYFYNPLESGNRRRLSTCGFIFSAHAGAHCINAQC